jgi:hypothetical protein
VTSRVDDDSPVVELVASLEDPVTLTDSYGVMKLPNGGHAIVDIRKLVEYCLSPEHPRGRNKARVFASVGVRENDAGALREALLFVAKNAEAEPGIPSVYGQRFAIDFNFPGNQRTVRIRSTWIVRNDETFPRLTSCYVL